MVGKINEHRGSLLSCGKPICCNWTGKRKRKQGSGLLVNLLRLEIMKCLRFGLRKELKVEGNGGKGITPKKEESDKSIITIITFPSSSKVTPTFFLLAWVYPVAITYTTITTIGVTFVV